MDLQLPQGPRPILLRNASGQPVGSYMTPRTRNIPTDIETSPAPRRVGRCLIGMSAANAGRATERSGSVLARDEKLFREIPQGLESDQSRYQGTDGRGERPCDKLSVRFWTCSVAYSPHHKPLEMALMAFAPKYTTDPRSPVEAPAL